MKDVSEITALCVDYGSFISLAEKLGETYAKVYYYSPFESEFRDMRKCCLGTGLANVTRLNEPLEPEVLSQIDLAIFPDIGYGGMQRYLRSIAIPVWGHLGAGIYELYRTRFIELLDEIGLPHVPTHVCQGLTELGEHLRTVKNKWIKIDRYRENAETRKHIDYEHSIPWLNEMAYNCGEEAQEAVFVVQDPIEDEEDSPVIEIGYDGWTVDGQFPRESFQGYEKKNELYLGSLLTWAKLPEEVRLVNEAIAPMLREFGYRCMLATELRVKDKIAHFIDPTFRMAGQTQEHLLETCKNLPQIIWDGANGILTQPEFSATFAAEATLHYTGNSSDGWKTLRIPEESARWFKFYHYRMRNGCLHFPPHTTDELGVVIGNGDTVQQAVDHLQANLDSISDEPIRVETKGFIDLVEEILQAEKQGLHFSDKPIPKPTEVV